MSFITNLEHKLQTAENKIGQEIGSIPIIRTLPGMDNSQGRMSSKSVNTAPAQRLQELQKKLQMQNITPAELAEFNKIKMQIQKAPHVVGNISYASHNSNQGLLSGVKHGFSKFGQGLTDVVHKSEHALSGVENSLVTAAENAGHIAKQDLKKFSHDLGRARDKLENATEQGLHKIGSDVKSVTLGARDLGEGLADFVSDVEGKVLPSPKAIISETALVVGGLAIVGLLVLKYA